MKGICDVWSLQYHTAHSIVVAMTIENRFILAQLKY